MDPGNGWPGRVGTAVAAAAGVGSGPWSRPRGSHGPRRVARHGAGDVAARRQVRQMTGHGHSHSYGAGPADHRGRLAVVLAITATVLVVEVVGAAVTGSLALLADAGHMLTDAAGPGRGARRAAWLMRRPATSRPDVGLPSGPRCSPATAQAAVLLAVGGFVLVEGVRRLIEPPEVASGPMLVFGVVGLVGNLVSIAVLLRGRRESLNMRAAFLEVANDALGSVAVLVAALVIATTGWTPGRRPRSC